MLLISSVNCEVDPFLLRNSRVLIDVSLLLCRVHLVPLDLKDL